LTRLRDFRTIEFEWDNAKAAANKAKHGVSFQDAADALGDRQIVEELDLDSDYGEERVIAYCILEGQILVVVYTLRGERYRIISARKADRHEQDHYYRENRT
jgi:uncharacterized DUF497 family protein